MAAYNAVAFRNKWIKQRVGIFDKNQIAINNALVDDMLSVCEFQNTSAGLRLPCAARNPDELRKCSEVVR